MDDARSGSGQIYSIDPSYSNGIRAIVKFSWVQNRQVFASVMEWSTII